jgi:hypothetical protein
MQRVSFLSVIHFYLNLGKLQNCNQLQSNVSCGGLFFSLGDKVCQWKNNLCEEVNGNCNMFNDEVTCSKLSLIIPSKCTFFNSNKTCGVIPNCLKLSQEDCSRGLYKNGVCYLNQSKNKCLSKQNTDVACRNIYVYFFI